VVGVAISVVETGIVRVLEFTYVVVRGVPLYWTIEEGENPEPFTVKVNDDPPATAAAGFRVVITGTG